MINPAIFLSLIAKAHKKIAKTQSVARQEWLFFRERIYVYIIYIGTSSSYFIVGYKSQRVTSRQLFHAIDFACDLLIYIFYPKKEKKKYDSLIANSTLYDVEVSHRRAHVWFIDDIHFVCNGATLYCHIPPISGRYTTSSDTWLLSHCEMIND